MNKRLAILMALLMAIIPITCASCNQGKPNPSSAPTQGGTSDMTEPFGTSPTEPVPVDPTTSEPLATDPTQPDVTVPAGKEPTTGKPQVSQTTAPSQDPGGQGGGQGGGTDSGDAEPIDIGLLEVVYPADISPQAYFVAGKLFVQLERAVFSPKFADDSQKASGPELLIGDTNRPASRKAMEVLTRKRAKQTDCDYVILAHEGSIAINATSDGALEEAIAYFQKTYCKGAFILPGDTALLYQPTLAAPAGNTIAGVDIGQYTIVTPVAKSYVYGREIEMLVDTIRKATGVAIPVVTEQAKEQAHEILIGDTTRAQSRLSLSEKQYVVRQEGGKIVVTGGHVYSIAGAVRQLAAQVAASLQKNGRITLADLRAEGSYTQPADGYRLTWNDEFSGDTLNTKNWKITNDQAVAWDGAYTIRDDDPEKVRLEDGKLLIQTNRMADGNFASGRIESRDRMLYQYGYLEIRAQLGAAKGHWPSFWVNGAGLSYPIMGEIDIFEVFGVKDTVTSNMHRWWNENGVLLHDDLGKEFDSYRRDAKLAAGESLGDAYHTFGLEWTTEKMVFYMDGQRYAEMDIQKEGMDMFHNPSYILINNSAGNTMIDPPDSSVKWPVQQRVDWIHLYQLPDVGGITWLN